MDHFKMDFSKAGSNQGIGIQKMRREVNERNDIA